MPQLDVTTFASQIFWLIVAFSVLYYLLTEKALPRVAEILEARQDRIAADLDEAQRLRAEAQQVLQRHEHEMDEARSHAQAILQRTQVALEDQAAKRHAELEERLQRQLTEAENRIAEAKQAALAELEDVAVTTAQAATERVAGVKVDKRTAQAAVKQLQGEAA
jgi:F-type H+-transporting ATPase subunit b